MEIDLRAQLLCFCLFIYCLRSRLVSCFGAVFLYRLLAFSDWSSDLIRPHL